MTPAKCGCMAECEHSHLCHLDMMETDECHNSCSCSGTLPVVIFLLLFLFNLMDILDLKHLDGKGLIHPGSQLYLQLYDGRPKVEKP